MAVAGKNGDKTLGFGMGDGKGPAAAAKTAGKAAQVGSKLMKTEKAMSILGKVSKFAKLAKLLPIRKRSLQRAALRRRALIGRRLWKRGMRLRERGGKELRRRELDRTAAFHVLLRKREMERRAEHGRNLRKRALQGRILRQMILTKRQTGTMPPKPLRQHGLQRGLGLASLEPATTGLGRRRNQL